MKKIGETIGKYLDDILYAVGVACATVGAFKFNEILGWLAAGAGMIAYALLIARR